MSSGQITGSYANTAKGIGINLPQRIRKAKKMKLSLRQRIRNWLMRDDDEADGPRQIIEADRLSSEGLRLQIYRASGGYVIETRSYDSHKDRNFTNMHVITEDHDLGESLGKIVMMEALKR